MSLPTDRVPVPTNGKRPHAGAPTPPAAGPATAVAEDDAPLTGLTFTPTPMQLAVGFGIVASLLLLVVGRLRRRSRSHGPFRRG